jgi:hypothetical protein
MSRGMVCSIISSDVRVSFTQSSCRLAAALSPALVDEARKIHVKTIASIKFGYTLAGNRRDVIESGALPALNASTSEIAMVDPSEWRTRGRADDDDLAEERFERGRVIGRPKVLESGDRLWTFVCEDGLRCECVPSRFIRFDSLKLSTLKPRKPRLLVLCEVKLRSLTLCLRLRSRWTASRC